MGTLLADKILNKILVERIHCILRKRRRQIQKMFVNQTRGSVDIIFCVFSLGGDALKILNHRKKTNSKGTLKRWAKKKQTKKKRPDHLWSSIE